MVHFHASFAPFQWPVIQIATAVLMAAPLPFAVQRPAAANEFESCANGLIEAGIEPSIAGSACGQALHPEEVSACVVGVVDAADVSALSALSACSRDRRPKEVANCVADIHSSLAVDNSSEVLSRCHLSVLPERYSACVVGLSDGVGLTVIDSLDKCLSAGVRPTELAPTFIPAQ